MRTSLLDVCLSLKRGETTARSLVKEGTAASMGKSSLNAFLHLDGYQAREDADNVDKKLKTRTSESLIAGSLISVKDNFMVRGVRSSAGSCMLGEYVADYDATVVRNIRSHDAVLFGKTNMDEFGMGASMMHSAFGRTWAPGGKDLSPGGSSGGSAVSVAAALCHGSIGSDTGGSVRQPASFCGLVGLKPTYGRLSRYGLISYASSMDVPGILTRRVLDAALLLDAMDSGTDDKDPTTLRRSPGRHDTVEALLQKLLPHCDEGMLNRDGDNEWQLRYLSSLKLADETVGSTLRGVVVGVPAEFSVHEVDSHVRAAWESTLQMLVDAGAEVRTISLPSLKSAIPSYYMLACAEASSNLSRYDGIRYGRRRSTQQSDGSAIGEDEDLHVLHQSVASLRGENFGPEVLRRILAGTYVLSQSAYHSYYEKALSVRQQITHELTSCFVEDGISCLVGPTSPVLPYSFTDPPGFGEMLMNDLMTVPANLAGLPAISVPAGVVSSPVSTKHIGMQLIGPPLSESSLLHVALAIEQRAGIKHLIN